MLPHGHIRTRTPHRCHQVTCIQARTARTFLLIPFPSLFPSFLPYFLPSFFPLGLSYSVYSHSQFQLKLQKSLIQGVESHSNHHFSSLPLNHKHCCCLWLIHFPASSFLISLLRKIYIISSFLFVAP